MREQIDQLVAAFEASLDDGSATPESFQQTVGDIQALEPITELDRLYHLAGTVRLLDAVLTRMAPDEGQPLRRSQRFVSTRTRRTAPA